MISKNNTPEFHHPLRGLLIQKFDYYCLKNHDQVTTAFLRKHENGGKTKYRLTSLRVAHHDALLAFLTRSSCHIHTSRYLIFH